jgi:hypothetical protein
MRIRVLSGANGADFRVIPSATKSARAVGCAMKLSSILRRRLLTTRNMLQDADSVTVRITSKLATIGETT